MQKRRVTGAAEERKTVRDRRGRKERKTAMGEINIRIVLQYDGSRYDGWQRQGNTDRTIQGKLEQVLEKMAGVPVRVNGAGRTDAGVHARGQAANFLLPESSPVREPGEVMEYLNRYLPEDIAVLRAERVSPRFHSRLNAAAKTYCYRIETAARRDVFERKYVYGLGRPLDVEAMERTAALLTGTHDFGAFCSLKRSRKSTVRTVYSIDVRRENTLVELTFRGNGFLYNMVRILAGTLIEAGLGARTPESAAAALAGKDRSRAGFTAPPEGLFLMEVEYSPQ